MELLLPQPEQAEMVICEGHRLRESRIGTVEAGTSPGHQGPSQWAVSSHVERPWRLCPQFFLSHTHLVHTGAGGFSMFIR